MFDDTDLAELRSDAYPGERLIVCRNERLARERARKREALLQATEALLAPIVAATQREKRRLKGQEKIALRVGKVIGKYKMAKHFELDITETTFASRRNTDAIAAEAALDGLYIVRTSVPATELDAEQTVRAYKGLSVVERAFRSLKTVDLKVRPIYHYAASRVRAHVLLCMLAYYVEWHMRQRLAEFHVQGGSIRIVGLYSVPARDSLAALPRVTAHFSIASTLSSGLSNSFSYLSRSRGYSIRNSQATFSKVLRLTAESRPGRVGHVP